MSRGLVYRELDGTVSLILVNQDQELEGMTISDYDEVYNTLPDNHADLVEVDNANDPQGLVVMNSLYLMSFSLSNKDVPAREAIRHAMEREPDKIVALLNAT